MHEKLFEDFTPTNFEDWIAKIHSDLKGKTIESLKREIHDQFDTSPFLTKEDLKGSPSPLDLPKRWKIIEDFRDQDATSINHLIRSLEGGAEGIHLTTRQYEEIRSNKSIFWDMITVLLEEQGANPELEVSALKCWKTSFLATNQDVLKSHFIIEFTDPVRAISNWLLEIVEQIDHLEEGQLAEYLSECWHTVEIGPHYILEIARLRAIRIVWDQVLKDYGHRQPCMLYARIGSKVRDASAYQNMINYSTAALSAAIGGADMIQIESLNDDKLSSATQSRIPRNIQHLMQLESHLDKVKDPAAGSYVIESLSQKIASEAWDVFLQKAEQPAP